MTIWDWVSSILWKIDLEEFKLNFTIIKKSNGAKKKKKKILPILVQSINISPIELSLERSRPTFYSSIRLLVAKRLDWAR